MHQLSQLPPDLFGVVLGQSLHVVTQVLDHDGFSAHHDGSSGVRRVLPCSVDGVPDHTAYSEYDQYQLDCLGPYSPDLVGVELHHVPHLLHQAAVSSRQRDTGEQYLVDQVDKVLEAAFLTNKHLINHFSLKQKHYFII